jgi:hypothetical protein
MGSEPDGDREPIRRNDQHLARSTVAVTLTVVFAALLLLDGVDPQYTLNERVFWALLTSIFVLLGYEGVDIVKKLRSKD